MSLKISLIKFVIKLTPNALIIWVANKVMKGFAELQAFNFDIDARKIYSQTLLYGEDVPIEVHLEDFAVFHDGDNYRFIIHHASSNKPWLNNLLARVIGKGWKIPSLPGFSAQLELVAELFKAKPVALGSETADNTTDERSHFE